MVLIVLLVFVVTLLHYLIQRTNSYWSNNGVPGPKPLPIVGNFRARFAGKMSVGEVITNIYKEYASYPFVGIYKATLPVLLIRDPAFLKNIFQKDFKNFRDNDIVVHKDLDPLFGRNALVINGTDWKNKKAQLTHFFTSLKIKRMYDFLENNSKRMVKYIEDESAHSTPLEAREVCIRFTLDNVAACAFGIEGRSFDETYSNFRELADKFISPNNVITKIKIWLAFLFPAINKLLRIRFVSTEVSDQLFELVKGTLKYRKENNVVGNDFLDACTKLSTKTGLFTDVDIVAHCANFFGDGYETSSRVMSFLLFELALNPDVQERLREEIIESYQQNGNKFTYDSIHDMQYLEACLKESLRKNSVIHFLSKVCTEDYTYTSNDPDFKNMTINVKAGTSIAIPLAGLQSDPKYFNEPDRFMPERFLGAKDDINKFTYLPFGEGHRVCIGQRFATTQIKVGVVHIFKNFLVTVNLKTQLPLKFDPYYRLVHAIGGLWLDFKKIELNA